jgi:radical SAM superfamily enzyme YgiQ (UPF0313 family)
MAIIRKEEKYQGFEQGPIRPPSEASSLLIRVTRNCPWNRCTFCPVYKGAPFSLRPVEHVIRDIDTVHHFITLLQENGGDGVKRTNLAQLNQNLDHSARMALSGAVNWIRSGMRSIFLQDANSLIIKPDNLIAILQHLKNRFPQVERITSYARSHTICRIGDDKLATMRQSGLNRIHIGMESGSDKVLQRVKKGSSKKDHICAGLKVKKAGMELSEYVMPGLGGVELWRDHALETADALNTINADFIRLRSLAIPEHVELYQLYRKGEFKKPTDKETAAEILLFLENLKGITSTLKSDHILNLFEEVQGDFPDDQDKMITVVKKFLQLAPHEQMLYQVGRRTGIFSHLADLNDPARRAQAEETCARFHITPANADGAIDELMKRFI